MSYDVVIVGAGPAGLATGLALLRCGPASVLIVDAGPGERMRIGESVPPELPIVLARLGLRERFFAGGHRAYPGSRVIWGSDGIGHTDAIASAMGPPWRLDRLGFDRMLADAVVRAGAELRWCTRVETRGSCVRLSDGTELAPRFCVDASGAGSWLARYFGARVVVDDRLFALVRRLAPGELDLDMRTHVEATPTGWWYLARLPDGQTLAMLVTDGETLRERGSPDGVWTEAAAGSRFLGSTIGPEQVLGVRVSMLDRLAGERWLAVGDAAASYDPIVGHGVLKALDDGIAAGRELARRLGYSVPGPVLDRAARVRGHYLAHRRERARLYASEARWPDAGFWSRRKM